MNDINENKVPEEVRLKIEKLEKNIDEYNGKKLSYIQTIAANILAFALTMSLMNNGVNEVICFLGMSFNVFGVLFFGDRMFDLINKRKFVKYNVEKLKNEWGIESERDSAKKRTRGR